MKGVKILGATVAIIIGLVVLLAVVGLVAVDAIAKTGIQRGGSYALGVPTTLDSADVGVFSGEFSMAGLQVDNPEGFSTPYFLSLGSGGVSVSLGTLMSDTVTLPRLHLSDLEVYLDKEEGSSNYQTILDNLERLESGEPRPDQPPAGEGKKFVISELEISNIVVHAELLPVGGEVSKVDIDLDTIRLTNVGSGGADPLELAEVVSVVVKAVIVAAIKTGGEELPEALLNDLEAGLAPLESLGELGVGVVAEIGGAAEELTGAMEEIGKGMSEGVEGAGKTAEDALEGVGDFLGGGKKDDEEDDERQDPGGG